MKLKESEFTTIREKIYQYCGINLHEGKQALVRSRVMKRIRKLGMSDFAQYINYLEQDGSGNEFLALVDVLTTNKTSFFREDQHFEFIRDEVIPQINGQSVKWWSAGCSTGEEPVTCSMVLQEEGISPGRVKILATDLSREVLRIGKRGVYAAKKVADIPPEFRNKYFRRVSENQFQVTSDIRKMITYGRLNLKKKWPMNGPFHIIMCRNVMIYFNRETQRRLVSRFRDMLKPGGYLFIGHSESVSSENKGLKNVCPAVYKKI
ncbi:CheR family methyltransferase [Fodinibius halophilus]|uniref:protein-glutamate O-methyltransferase n=1 Tax=Fodinibius halophilus TaxID=1736908 RepID=A0A6M1TFK8_9BACT|nr:protein-glutamate O-methyltransferase CheR [Fodinibius halophilus]NGP87420.1 protein-glutamate O-methyltransferase CheR [Fodinibius halophilus]